MTLQFLFIMWITMGFAALGALWAIAIISIMDMQKQIQYLYQLLEEAYYEPAMES